MIKIIRPSLTLLLLTTVVTGLLYPVVVTAIANLIFPEQAQGSLIKDGKDVVGSELIGQNFSGVSYFWGRPSATSPMPYNAANSMGSNLGPSNPVLLASVKERIANLRAAHPDQQGQVPTDLVTTSASGLDPHISPTAAFYQVQRVSKARDIETKALQSLIEQSIEQAQWGLFGAPRVNVLRLNLKLDALSQKLASPFQSRNKKHFHLK